MFGHRATPIDSARLFPLDARWPGRITRLNCPSKVSYIRASPVLASGGLRQLVDEGQRRDEERDPRRRVYIEECTQYPKLLLSTSRIPTKERFLSMSIYFDYNATTPLAPSVIEKIGEALRTKWGNPSSSYNIGKNAKESIDEARTHVALMIQAKPEDIIFTSGGTEANNMVIFGILEYFKRYTDSLSSAKIPMNDYTGKPHVITTNVEHDAVILPLRYLERRGEIDLSIVPVSGNGVISVEDVIARVKQNTCLITVMHANNETGVIMPVVEIGRSLKKLNKERKSKGYVRILYHTDSAQAIGKINVDVNAMQVDYLTIVGHKFYGPRIGALFIRGPASASHIQPMFYGGGQERGWRPGTENTPMIVGLGEASRLVHENLNSYHDHMLSIRTYLEEKLVETFGKDGIHFNCASSDRLPNTSNVSLVGDGLYGHILLSKCQFLTASIGAACHKQNKPSEILLASGIQPETAANAIRLSVGRDTTKNDVDSIVIDLKQAVSAVQQQHNETIRTLMKTVSD